MYGSMLRKHFVHGRDIIAIGHDEMRHNIAYSKSVWSARRPDHATAY